MSPAWYEQPFREACLAVLPERLAVLLRATGRGMVQLAKDESMVAFAADPRGLLRGLRSDLEAVNAGLGELRRPRDVAPGTADLELAEAARELRTEVRRLVARIDALLAHPGSPEPS